MKLKNDWIAVVVLLLSSIVMRWRTLPTTPFWVDEFSTAHEAYLLQKYGWSIFSHRDVFFEFNKFLPSFLALLSFSISDWHELSARIPILIIGTLIPPAIYLLAREWYGRTAAFCAGLFAVNSYIMITWSRQARGYALLQLCIILLFLSYTRLLLHPHRRNYIFFIVVAIVGILTHPMFFIAIAAVCIHAVLLARNQIKPVFLVVSTAVAGIALALMTYLNAHQSNSSAAVSPFHLVNNVAYYHSYLWRTQTLVTFLGILGMVLAYSRHRRATTLVIIYLALHLLFICVLFGPFVIRYTLPVIPFFYIGSAVSITFIVRTFFMQKNYHAQAALAIVMTGFIILNGDTFSPKPKQFYSVNHEFREIALINYPEIYDIIRQKGDLAANKTAVIDTWPDRTGWYIGYEYPHIMLFRWIDGGLMKKTDYTRENNGSMYVAGRKETRFVPNLAALKKVMAEFPKGFIIIDDTTLPQDVQDFARLNLKKQKYLDHFALDDNPSSVWPVTLYSWGVQ